MIFFIQFAELKYLFYFLMIVAMILHEIDLIILIFFFDLPILGLFNYSSIYKQSPVFQFLLMPFSNLLLKSSYAQFNYSTLILFRKLFLKKLVKYWKTFKLFNRASLIIYCQIRFSNFINEWIIHQIVFMVFFFYNFFFFIFTVLKLFLYIRVLMS